ncbi:MAG: GH32 C-terminal domain-containing protein [Muribaculaceae bacterium]|nr:GH32 C-terminal domain-containing protein [Muribaculaceae bacterium]
MKKINRIITCAALTAAAPAASAGLVAHFSMDVRSGQIVEDVSGERFGGEGHFAPENVPGAVGKALRFDGYTSHVDAALGSILPAGCKQMTVAMWVATPSYPIIQIDTDTSEKTPIATCINEADKTGFGFYLGFNGKYSFRTYVGGWPVNIDVDTPLPTYQWNCLTAVIDCEARSVKLYNNGVEVGSGRANGTLSLTRSTFYMGQGTESRMSGPFELMSFNGLIDDISVWDEALDLATIQSWKPENEPDLDIPASRFADQILRPRFHGMPAAGWTNECHGMVYSAGRYHLFFQKNADGPYMARLHWGHISSENLYDWREEKIAIAPGDPYDIKGCWSGCVFTDDAITGGRPNILYTAVDYGRASIAQAAPQSLQLNNWTKSAANPIISGRPGGLSDDFRDPYFFRSGDDAYIIVGSSKDGVGTTTLHRYNPASGTWSNNGDLFFTGSNAATDGTFWEMPNVTEMPGGKWLFTATPLGTSQGVRTLYWTGSIAADGRFQPSSTTPKLVEMISRDGFGLLSPTIYRHDGKTIVLGIVPDKLSSNSNWDLGWAHCYSLPREWSLTDDGTLVQKPFEGLTGLRGPVAFSRGGFDLSGTESLAPVSGRSVEILGNFKIGMDRFGFNIFKNSSAKATITYNPTSGVLEADFSSLRRLVNDGGVYDGVYSCPLPTRPALGSTLKLNVFIDHSIIDIFVNDTWATSIRVFPTDADADGIEMFSEGSTQVYDLNAWVLTPAGTTGVSEVTSDSAGGASSDVYDLRGVRVCGGSEADSAGTLSPGIYVTGGRKFIVK